jgi:hypothetical protein
MSPSPSHDAAVNRQIDAAATEPPTLWPNRRRLGWIHELVGAHAPVSDGFFGLAWSAFVM